MYRFHITGYESIDKNSYYYNGDRPIDITLFAESACEALEKAENVSGTYISTTHRKIAIEELSDKEHIEGLEYILMGVMHSVDKWLEGEEFDQDEVNRAATMREKVLRIIEEKDRRILELEKELKEVIDKPNPFTLETCRDDRIDEALNLAYRYAQIDGGWHKMWVIDQMVRVLCGSEEAYKQWVEEYKNGGEYSWDTGITP